MFILSHVECPIVPRYGVANWTVYKLISTHVMGVGNRNLKLELRSSEPVDGTRARGDRHATIHKRHGGGAECEKRHIVHK